MFKRILHIYVIPFFLSVCYTIGLGFWDYLFRLKDIPVFFVILVFNTYFFIYLNQSRGNVIKDIALFLFLILSLYISTSTGFLQGHMSLGIVASAFQTNQNEAFEFFSIISAKYLVFGLILFLSTFYYLYKYDSEFKVSFNKKVVFFLLFLNIINTFFVQTLVALNKYKKEEKILTEDNTGFTDWKIKKITPKYDNQIIIIGESVPRAYLSLYGFKEKTTPFLDKAPVEFVDHYISTAPNTATSLVRTLAYMDESHNIDIQRNVVTLANQAKYNTIWISNQGFLGKNDTAVSRIAIHANHKFFLKSGNYRSKNTDDDVLLGILNSQLNKYKDQKNVIFIHMMGSHPDACERLFKQPKMYPQYGNSINCYLSSFNKLDNFIQSVYNQLGKTKRSFSITYFSDHGMTVHQAGYNVDNKTKKNYDIPFFILASDIKKRDKIEKTVSAYDFLNIYADQLGVQSLYLNDKRNLKEIPTNENVQVFNWENYIPYHSLD